MKKPEIPDNEHQRLDALNRLDVLDTPPEERFDRITRLAQRLLKTPIVLISLVDAERQWFKSRQGLDAAETSRDISFCGHAILDETIFLVPDASLDSRFSDNPLVTGAPGIRFYAGAPLHGPTGERVGTLCAIDRSARVLSEDEREALRDLAACVDAELARTELLDVATRLQSAEERIRAIVENVVDGIITIDDRATILTLNPAAERLFGYEKTELIGKNVNILTPGPDASGHDGYKRNHLSSGETWVIGVSREVVGKRKDGSVFPMELSIGEFEAAGARLFAGVVRDVSERKDSEARVQALTALRQAILDSASVSIISTDARGIIQTFNRTAERWLGFRAEELIGIESPGRFHDPAEVAQRAEDLTVELGIPVEPGFEAFVAKARLGGVDEREWTYIRKDGSRFPVHLSVTLLKAADGRETGFLGTAVDLTAQKQAERAKNEFISTVSHELRTPLTSIRGALGLVLGKATHAFPDSTRRLLEMADRNSERLTILINDLLDLEKIEGGRLEFEFEGVDLGAVASQAIADNEGFARQHNIRLVLKEPVPQAVVRGDKHRLLQVFANLISNAVKFSPPQDDVVVSVESRPGNRVRVTVRDHGSGVPESFRALIFQRFAQADSSDSRARGGTGLGLSISKAIVERHDGRIGFETEVDVGTAFHFDLPLFEEKKLAPETGGLRALVCEDSPDVASVLEAILKEEGVVCDIAFTAKGARELLALRRYRLLLLDVTLPDGNGLELLRELRSAPATEGLPVVVVSGRAPDGLRATLDASALTLVDWIQKPIDHHQLVRAVRLAMPREGGRPRILHAEDDEDVVRLISTVLEEFADVVAVSTRAEAARRIAREAFDLVILDLTLADGSGADLLEIIGGRCPVVIFSAQMTASVVSRAVEAALTKSTTSNEEFLAVIKRAVASNV